MGNIEADASGVAKVDVTLPTATLTGKNAILGRGVIVHAKADDYSQPVGNAGGRIGCGVIGVAQVKK
jgi:Cu-Zn family superoxide dismutase